ncbi:hypothetical protein [Nocardia brasiliensis]|uniref:hypothetical protein n=1 Tax=Nocardia brasiliensis TaxID=37326 RepID=UPI00366B1DEE
MSDRVRVVAPLVVAAGPNGLLRYHYEGAVIEDLSAADIDRLLDDGMIELCALVDDEGDDGIEVLPVVASSGGTVTVPAEVERPKQAAPKEAWVAFAVARGIDEAEAEALTKTELIGLVGSE